MFIYSDESEQEDDYRDSDNDDDCSHEARNISDCDVNDNDNASPHSIIVTMDNTMTTTHDNDNDNGNYNRNDNDINQKGKQKQQHIDTHHNNNTNNDFFSIMDPNKVRSAQAAAIRDVMSICCVSESTAFHLLKHYQWSNVSHAVEEWFTKEDQLRKTLGLGHNTNDHNNDNNNYHSSNNWFNNSCTNSRQGSWSDNDSNLISSVANDINNNNKEEKHNTNNAIDTNSDIQFMTCGICLEMCPESDLISSPACVGISRPISSSSSGNLHNSSNKIETLCDTKRTMSTTLSSSQSQCESPPHLFCRSCYYQYVRSAVLDGPANCLTLKCPMPECKTLLPTSFIMTCLEYNNIDDHSTQNAQNAQNNNDGENYNDDNSDKTQAMVTDCFQTRHSIGNESNNNNKSMNEGNALRDRFERFMLESYVNDNASVKWCPAPNCPMAIKINKVYTNKNKRRRSDSRRRMSRSKSIQISSNNPNSNHSNKSKMSFSLSPQREFYRKSITSSNDNDSNTINNNNNNNNSNNDDGGGFASSMEDVELLQDCIAFSDDSSDDECCPNAISQKLLPRCRCSCGFSFCYTCGYEYHSPVNCSIVRQWQLKCANEAQNLNWILENSKPCPSCSRPIEKDHGCMHMTCSVCKYEFCWLCGEPWSLHSQKTGGFYSCNRYKSRNNNNNNNNNSSQTLLRQVAEAQRDTTNNNNDNSLHTHAAGNHASRSLGRNVEDTTTTTNTATDDSLGGLIDYAVGGVLDLGAGDDEVLLERRRQQEEEMLLFGFDASGNNATTATTNNNHNSNNANGIGMRMSSIGNVTIQNINRGGASSSGTNNNNNMMNGWNWTANNSNNNMNVNVNVNMNRKSSKPSRYGRKNFGSLLALNSDYDDEHSLQRYLHYYERFSAHEKASVQAQQQYDYVELGIISNNTKNSKNKNKNKSKDKIKGKDKSDPKNKDSGNNVMKTRPFLLELCERLQMPLSQLKFISEALEQVVECRRVLKWTYAYGYLLDINTTTTRSADWEAKKNFFEFQQGEAEWSLEKLHEEVEKTMGVLLKIKGMSHNDNEGKNQINKNNDISMKDSDCIEYDNDNDDDNDDGDGESKKKSRSNKSEPRQFRMAWQSASYHNEQDKSSATKSKNKTNQRQNENKQTTKKKRGSSNSVDKEMQRHNQNQNQAMASSPSSSTSTLFLDITEFDAFRCTLTGLTSVTREYFDSLVSGLETGHTLSAIGKGIDFSASV